jgi:hypothetical protein
VLHQACSDGIATPWRAFVFLRAVFLLLHGDILKIPMTMKAGSCRSSPVNCRTFVRSRRCFHSDWSPPTSPAMTLTHHQGLLIDDIGGSLAGATRIVRSMCFQAELRNCFRDGAAAWQPRPRGYGHFEAQWAVIGLLSPSILDRHRHRCETTLEELKSHAS